MCVIRLLPSVSSSYAGPVHDGAVCMLQAQGQGLCLQVLVARLVMGTACRSCPCQDH